MPHRVRRIPHDHPDVQIPLPLAPFTVVFQQCAHQILALVHLEGIGQADSLEWHVPTTMQLMVGGLDVDGGYVVGEQHDLVGMDLVLVLVLQLCGPDQTRLQQARDEGAGAGEGVHDVDPLAAQRLAKLLLQKVIDAVQDEVDHLDRCVNDAETIAHLGKGATEELVIQLQHDLLFARGIVDTIGT